MAKIVFGVVIGAVAMYVYFEPAQSKAYARSALHTLSDTASDGAKVVDSKLAK